MTEQEYMREQARLRAFINAYRDARGPSHVFLRETAQQELRALVERYKVEHPPLTGTFHYTEEDVKEARQHGY